MDGALLEFGPDEDPSQGYRVRVRTAGGMDAAVWLDAAQQSRLAEGAMIHKEQAAAALGCDGCGHGVHAAGRCAVVAYGEPCACDEPLAAISIMATVRHRCQFCREPISRWRWWLRGAMCGTCGVRVGMGGVPQIPR